MDLHAELVDAEEKLRYGGERRVVIDEVRAVLRRAAAATQPVDTAPILCRGYDLIVVDWDGPESGESRCSLTAGHQGQCRTADGWSFVPINYYEGDPMAYPDSHEPPPPATQVSDAIKADRPTAMMSGEPPFPERTGQAVDPKYRTEESTTDKVFGTAIDPLTGVVRPVGPVDPLPPKFDLDPADKAALRDPNPASLGGRPSDIMRWFSYEHLPNERVRGVSRQFSELAWWVEQYLPSGPEKSVALRQLLVAKDAAVRSAIEAEENGQ